MISQKPATSRPARTQDQRPGSQTGSLRWLVLLCLPVLAAIASIFSGKFGLAPDEVLHALMYGVAGWAGVTPAPDEVMTVVWQLRMPRLLAGLLAGAVLAAAGAAYQNMFRNPLVSPDILGVSSGAGLGASLAIFLGLPLLMVQGFAFVGGLLAVVCVWLLARWVRRHDTVLVMVLAGIALGALLGAGISLLKLLADPYTQLPTITFWLLGGLNSTSMPDLARVLPFILVGLLPMLLLRWRVNLLSLPDEEARALGVNVTVLRWLLVAAATLMTASVVSFSGIIGWVGLFIPHMARLVVGPGFTRLLPASLLLGSAFLVAVDTLARILAPIELPLGLLTAFLGAPFFMYLLARGRRSADD